MATREQRILILCKTYPSPSAKHAETSCVAGITESGEVLRLFPVPFRLIDDAQKFRKWQWITARIRRSPDDRRKESHRIYVDTIELGEVLPSDGDWKLRRPWLDVLPTFVNFEALEEARQEKGGPTLGLLRPNRILGLDITAVDDPNWTDEEKAKLLKAQQQGNLFKETDRELRLLRKLPYDFHYNYECVSPDGPKVFRHKIVDWEAGALYWNVYKKHGANWEKPFRDKFERSLPSGDLLFLMGTIHRFPNKWLIVSLIYPPKPPRAAPHQELLFAK